MIIKYLSIFGEKWPQPHGAYNCALTCQPPISMTKAKDKQVVMLVLLGLTPVPDKNETFLSQQ